MNSPAIPDRCPECISGVELVTLSAKGLRAFITQTFARFGRLITGPRTAGSTACYCGSVPTFNR